MKQVRNALIGVIALVLVVVLSFGWTTSKPEPAHADEGCIIQIDGTLGIVICGGTVIDQLNLPTVKITETVVDEIIKEVIKKVPYPVPGNTVTVTAPGGTRTVTMPPRPNATKTVAVPGETRTITVPGETKTVREGSGTTRPRPTQTITISPSESPSTTTPDDHADDSTNAKGRDRTIDFGDGKTNIVEVGIGVLGLLALVAILLLALYAGYVLGWKDKERKDSDFMGALLDQSKLRKRP